MCDLPPMRIRAGARHAANLYRRALRRAPHPISALEAEAHHLHEVERSGASAETPIIAILGVFLFLLPIFLLMVGIAFVAYYLSR